MDSSSARKPILVLMTCVMGTLLTLAPTLWLGRERILVGDDDYLSFYAGSRLAGTPLMYDADTVRRVQIEAVGRTGLSQAYIRMPWFALLFWPLAQLPYRIAHAAWFALRFLAVVAFVWLWPHSDRGTTAMVCCWSLPLAAGLANAQDTPLLLLWLALSERFQKSGKPVHAGVLLSLCTAKFQLFLLLPLLYVILRRWVVLAGGAIGCLVLAMLSMIGGFWNWPSRWVEAVLRTEGSTTRSLMPNIHGLFPGGWIEWLVTVMVVVAAAFIMMQTDYLSGLAAALAGSLLVSYHAYLQDALLLIPAILIVLTTGRAAAARAAAWVAATPIPWLLLASRGYTGSPR